MYCFHNRNLYFCPFKINTIFLLSEKKTNWLILIFLGFVWGASFILIKRGLETFSATQVAALRMGIASLITLPFGLKLIRKITRKNIIPIVAVAFIGNFIPAFFFSFAQTNINSSLAGMLNSTTPLFALLFAFFVFKSRITKTQAPGVIIGLLGAFGLIVTDNIADIFSFSGYEFFVLAATMMYGYNVNQVKYFLKGLSGFEITVLAYLFVFPVSVVILLCTDLGSSYAHPDFAMNLLYIFVLAFVGSVLAVVFINVLIQRAGALFASSVTYIIPVFAVFWGIADGEVVTGLQATSIGVVLLGVYLVNKNQSQPKTIRQ